MYIRSPVTGYAPYKGNGSGTQKWEPQEENRKMM